MLGLMSDFPLLLHRIIDHAAKFHGERKVITRSVEGPIVETNYAQVRARSLKVAQRLERDLSRGGRIIDQCEEPALAFPQRPVLRQVAPGLAHQPHRTARAIGSAQGIEEETGHRSGPIQ